MGAIAFENFGKESQETIVRFFIFVFYQVVHKTLAFYLWLPNIHSRLSFDCIFVYCVFGKLSRSFFRNFRESCRHCFFFWKQKQERYCVQCCHGNFVTLSIFAVVLVLRRNRDTINQSNLRNFSAYTIKRVKGLVIWKLSETIWNYLKLSETI